MFLSKEGDKQSSRENTTKSWMWKGLAAIIPRTLWIRFGEYHIHWSSYIQLVPYPHTAVQRIHITILATVGILGQKSARPYVRYTSDRSTTRTKQSRSRDAETLHVRRRSIAPRSPSFPYLLVHLLSSKRTH